MSSEHFRRDEKDSLPSHREAQTLLQAADMVTYKARQAGVSKLKTRELFFPDPDQDSIGLPGHYESTGLLLNGKKVGVKDWVVEFDDGSTGHAISVYGNELLMDRSDRGISGPFVINLLFDNDRFEVTGLWAHCFASGEIIQAPKEVVLDTALCIQQAEKAGTLEYSSSAE